MPELRMRFFGGFRATLDEDTPVELKSKKAKALLCYLAVTGAPHERLGLASLLWSDLPEENARMNLRKVITNLKRTVEPFLIISTDTLALDPDSQIWTDVGVLEDAATLLKASSNVREENLDKAQKAAELYRGEFLAGFYLRNAGLFEEWAQVQQVRLRETALDLVQSLAQNYTIQGRAPEAIDASRWLLRLEPWREQAHRQLMLLLAQTGRRGEALAQYELCRQALADEFAVEPAQETIELMESIRDGAFETTRERPVDQLKKSSKSKGAPPASPYRGLFAFRKEDARFFFGRETYSQRVLTSVQRQPLLVIIGPSGSGKSSLANAGLAAGLSTEDGWQIATSRPGSQPLQALAASLVPLLETTLTETDLLVESRKMAEAMRGGELSLRDVVNRINQVNELQDRILILIDQFEELYTLGSDEQLQQIYLDQILELVRDQHQPLKPEACVTLTLRADFMEQALTYRPLAEALQDSTLILGPMSREELAVAIEKPAQLQGVNFEVGLVERILDDVGMNPGRLPLLEFALAELWQEQDDWLLTHKTYEAIGRVEGALANHAENIYQSLSEGDRLRARRIFTQLVTPGSREEDTRRFALRQEMGDANWPLVRRLADERLLVTGSDLSGRETAELVHEALISAWKRLKKWLDEDRAFRLWQERLRTGLATWRASDRDEGALLRGGPLSEAEGWLSEKEGLLSLAEVEFIEESQALRDQKQIAREQARSARERNRLRIITALSILFVAAIGAMVFAFSQSRRAEAQAQMALARELTLAAISNLDTDPELGIHLAIKAVEISRDGGGAVLAEAEEALHLAIQSLRVVYSLPYAGGVAFSQDGSLLAAGNEDGSVTLVKGLTGERVATFSDLASAVTSIDISHDGTMLAAVSEEHHAIVRDLISGRVIFEVNAENQLEKTPGSSTVSFSPDSQQLLLIGAERDAEIWDLSSGEKMYHFMDSGGPDAAFNSAGNQVALTVAAWDIARTGDTAQTDQAENHNETTIISWQDRRYDFANLLVGIQEASSNSSALRESGSVAYSPDGSYLLTTAISNQAILIDAGNGELVKTLSGHGGIIHEVAFSPDGKRAATVSADSRIFLWDVETGERLLSLEGHQDEVVDLAFHPGGHVLATSSLDGTTRLWDISLASRGELFKRTDHDGLVFPVIDHNGEQVISGGEEGSIAMVSMLSGSLINRLEFQ